MPVARLPKPMVVVTVFGAIVRVELPEIAAPIVIASVLIVKALAPIAIEPDAPVVKVPAVIVVAPKTVLELPPTTPFMATVPLPALMESVLAVLLLLFNVPLNVTLLSDVANAVFAVRVTASLYNWVPVVVILAPMLVVPDTERLVTPVTAPLTTALPVTA